MAHLPDDTLPSQFDAVVDGSGELRVQSAVICRLKYSYPTCLRLVINAAGLVQTIVAAALTRAGRSVLHIDKYVAVIL